MSPIHETDFSSIRNLKIICEDEPIYVVKRRTHWKEELLTMLCRHFGCYFIHQRHGKLIACFLIGRKEMLLLVRIFYENYLGFIRDDAHAAHDADGMIAVNSFCHGFVVGLNNNTPFASDRERMESFYFAKTKKNSHDISSDYFFPDKIQPGPFESGKRRAEKMDFDRLKEFY